MNTGSRTLHVSMVAIPDAVISTLSGMYDVLNSFEMLAGFDEAIPAQPPFELTIVGARTGPLELASGMPIQIQRAISDVSATDLIIVPSVLVGPEGWVCGRYPEMTTWLSAMHEGGAVLCSACSGIFLLAETGAFRGVLSTVHWGYADAFRRAFPDVPVSPEQVLLTGGENAELISSGAAHTWHDLVLYLIARYVSEPAAQAVAKFFALQWHRDGMMPYMKFDVPTDHGDAIIADAQAWLVDNYAIANPVDEVTRRSGLAPRSFSRRFGKATGYPPMAYVQRLRVEEAKRRLERTAESVDRISWAVGYEDASYFRRVFRRLVGIPPASYRRKFQVPNHGGRHTD